MSTREADLGGLRALDALDLDQPLEPDAMLEAIEDPVEAVAALSGFLSVFAR